MPVSAQRLFVNEVAPRDGFQNESTFIPTEEKIAVINALSRCGLAKIEVTSFTSPRAIPALADAEAVMKQIDRIPGVVYTALIPNLRGAERALDCAIDEMNVVMSVSETHNLANLRMLPGKSFEQLQAVIAMAALHSVPVNVSLSTAFGCPMEGAIAPEKVYGWIDRYTALGAAGITLCDTTGMANPAQVAAIAEEARRRFPAIEFTFHFHNTRGMALANVMAAVNAGIERFDASLGGLGGCPYAPGATGNACTEDMVHMFEQMGLTTGVDLDGLLAAASGLPAILGHDLPSHILKAGPSTTRHPAPAFVADLRARLAHDSAGDG